MNPKCKTCYKIKICPSNNMWINCIEHKTPREAKKDDEYEKIFVEFSDKLINATRDNPYTIQQKINEKFKKLVELSHERT